MNLNLVRKAAVLLIVAAAVVGVLQLTAETAEAYGCSAQYNSCLSWCTGSGGAIYGSYGSCRASCSDMYCARY